MAKIVCCPAGAAHKITLKSYTNIKSAPAGRSLYKLVELLVADNVSNFVVAFAVHFTAPFVVVRIVMLRIRVV